MATIAEQTGYKIELINHSKVLMWFGGIGCCKRAGMHWIVAGADAIIALRCCKLSGRFEDFWERRSTPSIAC